MALVLVLIALIIAMGCGALACRWLMADNGQVRHIAGVPPSGADGRAAS